MGRDLWGKPGVPQYEPLGHTPLLIAWPGVAGGGTCDALTTNVDLFATIADAFGGDRRAPHPRACRSSRCSPGAATSVRDWAIGGVYGNWVQVTDGARKYARGPVERPLPALDVVEPVVDDAAAHRRGIEALPEARRSGVARPDAGLDDPGDPPAVRGRATGSRSGSGRAAVDRHELYDLDVDPDEQENRLGDPDRSAS